MQAADNHLQAKLTNLFRANAASYDNDAGDVVLPASAMLDILRAFSAEYGVTLLKPSEEENLGNTVASMSGFALTPGEMMTFIEALASAPTPVAENGNIDPLLSTPAPKETSRKTTSPLEARPRSIPLEQGVSGARTQRPQAAHRRRRSEAGSLGGGSDSESLSLKIRRRSGGLPSAPTSPALGPRRSSSPYSLDVVLHEEGEGIEPSPLYSPSGSNRDDDRYFTRSPYSRPSSSSSQRFPTDLLLTLPTTPEHETDNNSDIDPNEMTLHPRSTTTSLLSISSPRDRIDALQRANTDLMKKLRDSERELQNKLSDHEAELEDMQLKIEDLRSELAARRREDKELRVKARTTSAQMTTLEAEISKLQRLLDSSKLSYQHMQKQYQEQCVASERYRDIIRKKDQDLKLADEATTAHHHELSKWKSERESAESTIATLEAELTIARHAQTTLDEQKQANLLLKETIDRLRFDLDEIRTVSAAGSGASSTRGTFSKGTKLMGRSKGDKALLESLAAEMGEDFGGDENDGDAEKEEEEEGEGERDGFVETIVTTRRRVGGHRSQKPSQSTPLIKPIKEYVDAYTQHDLSEFMASIHSQTDSVPTRAVASFGTQTLDDEDISVSGKRSSADDGHVQADTSSAEADKSAIPSSQTAEEAGLNGDDVDDVDSDVDDDGVSSTSTVRDQDLPSPGQFSSKGKEKNSTPDLPPSYAHLEAEEKERVGQEYIQRMHPGLGSPISLSSFGAAGMVASTSTITTPFIPTNAGVSYEAIEEWKRLKRELGFECLAIDHVLKNSVILGPRDTPSPNSHSNSDGSRRRQRTTATMTPRLAREWANQVKAAAEADELPMPGERSPRRRFYNIYNTYFYPRNRREEGAAGTGGWNVMMTGIGVWALVMMTAAVLPNMRSPELPDLYSDRKLWSAYNALSRVPPLDGFGGRLVVGPTAGDAMWTVAEQLLHGAVGVVRRTPPS